MVKIALNQHGTRALQKMIEFVSTPEQVFLAPDFFHGILLMPLDPNRDPCPQGQSCGVDSRSQWQSCYSEMS